MKNPSFRDDCQLVKSMSLTKVGLFAFQREPWFLLVVSRPLSVNRCPSTQHTGTYEVTLSSSSVYPAQLLSYRPDACWNNLVERAALLLDR